MKNIITFDNFFWITIFSTIVTVSTIVIKGMGA